MVSKMKILIRKMAIIQIQNSFISVHEWFKIFKYTVQWHTAWISWWICFRRLCWQFYSKYTTDRHKELYIKRSVQGQFPFKIAYSRLLEQNECRLIHLVLNLHKYTTCFISFHEHSTVGKKSLQNMQAPLFYMLFGKFQRPVDKNVKCMCISSFVQDNNVGLRRSFTVIRSLRE